MMGWLKLWRCPPCPPCQHEMQVEEIRRWRKIAMSFLAKSDPVAQAIIAFTEKYGHGPNVLEMNRATQSKMVKDSPLAQAPAFLGGHFKFADSFAVVVDSRDDDEIFATWWGEPGVELVDRDY